MPSSATTTRDPFCELWYSYLVGIQIQSHVQCTSNVFTRMAGHFFSSWR